MVTGINLFGGGWHNTDYEYLRILRELQRLGIVPTGNKQIDKSKLEKVKKYEAEQTNSSEIENKQTAEVAFQNFYTSAGVLSDINKYLLGL